MKAKAEKLSLEPLLSPRGTFVIQLRSDSDIETQRLYGRVEHVMSGTNEAFTSLEHLLRFMTLHTRVEQASSKEGEVR